MHCVVRQSSHAIAMNGGCGRMSVANGNSNHRSDLQQAGD